MGATKRKTFRRHVRRTPRTPRQARTDQQLCALPRTTWQSLGWWFLVDVRTVTIAKQRNGEPAEALVTVPRAVFETFVRAYETGSTRRLPGEPA